jgi:hypothetical protein
MDVDTFMYFLRRVKVPGLYWDQCRDIAEFVW